MLQILLLAGAVLHAAPSGTVHLVGRVVDADTGSLLPCTIAIRSDGGAVLTDHPSYASGFRSIGTFEKDIAPGHVTIEVTRGFDYAGERREIDVLPERQVEIEFRLRRQTPLRKLGWYASDNHVHMVHGERKVNVDFEYISLAGRAEALDLLSICQQWNLPEVTPEALDQACARVSRPDFRLTWNLEAPKNYWRGDAGRCVGHGWTVGMRGRTADGRDAISELLEMSAWDYEVDKPPVPNFEIQDFIHSLGGMVSYTHPHRWWWGLWGGKNGYPLRERMRVSNMAAELPFDTIAGPTYDTIDIMMQPNERETNRKAQALWFMLLNHGYRIAATASSDTTFDNPGGGVPGKVRVYTHVHGELTPQALAAAMKAGRNFVTSGPLLLLEIDGREPGDTIRLGEARKLVVALRAWASGKPKAALARVELVRNGEVVRTFEPRPGATTLEEKAEVSESGPAWYAARCFGANDAEQAVTNAIYVEQKGFEAPQPVPAHVHAVAHDADTGRALEGTYEIVRMDGRKPVVTASHAFAGGAFDTVLPATVRIRVRAEGYAPETKSVFMDSALLQPVLDMTDEQLSDWATFEKIRRDLGAVKLEFQLRRERP